MKRFKQYLHETNSSLGYSVLLEELTPEQKDIVDSWTKHSKSNKAVKISSHVIPEGQDRISIPLEHEENAENVSPHPDVEKHLSSHGYSVSDYKKGMAKDKYGRDVSIGKLLNKTKAPKEVMDAFTNDPRRKGSTKAAKGLNVVISRHPHDVAGMSTNQGWTSCMNMESGCNRHYLEDDINHGTHVAYLTHKDDTEAKHPLARIALKPFHSDDGKDTILRPESIAYGDADSSFEKTIRNWTEKNFPFKKGQVYKKNEFVYHDSGAETVGNFEDMINHKDPDVRYNALYSPEVTTKHLEKATNDEDMSVRLRALRHPLTTNDMLKRALTHKDVQTRVTAAKQPNLTDPIAIDKAFHDKESHVKGAAMDNPNMSPETLDKAQADKNPSIRRLAIGHPNVQERHIEKALNDQEPAIRETALLHPKATPKHIERGFDDKNVNVRQSLFMRNDLTPQHIDKALNDKDTLVRQRAITHPAASAENISKALDDKHEDVQMAATHNPNLTPEHINKALDSPHRYVRLSAIGHDNANEDNYKKALTLNDHMAHASVFRKRPDLVSDHLNSLANSAETPKPALKESRVKTFKQFVTEAEIPFDRNVNQGWWNDDRESIELYHGTHKKNIPSVEKSGISVPDPRTGMISTSLDPNTAHGYAAMSSGERRGEHSFRRAGQKAVTTPEKDRAVAKFKVPMSWVKKHVDPDLRGNIGMAENRMKDKKEYDKWRKENPSKSDSEYYATSELRFSKPIPSEFYAGHSFKVKK